MLQRARNPLTWLALVAMLAMALLPSVSHALAFARNGTGGNGGWVEVCTPQGMRMVAVDADAVAGDPAGAVPAPTQATGFLEHCPLCALAADTAPLPPAALAALPDVRRGDPLPLLFLQGPSTLYAWRSAQPRGPPSLS
jgi:hypothetical protein